MNAVFVRVCSVLKLCFLGQYEEQTPASLMEVVL